LKYNYSIIIIDAIITWGTLVTIFSVGAGWYAFLIIPFGIWQYISGWYRLMLRDDNDRT
jgi:hypothetical protein